MVRLLPFEGNQMNMSQELFNTLMSALHLAYDEDTDSWHFSVDSTDAHDAIQSISDMYPDLRKVWWTENSWKFNGFPE